MLQATRRLLSTKVPNNPGSSAVPIRRRPPYSSSGSDIITQEDALKWRDMSPRQKVVFATKQTSYTGVIIAGIGMTTVLLALAGSAVLGTTDEARISSKAMALVKDSEEVRKLFGDDVKEVVQPGRRARRATQHRLDVSYDKYTGNNRGFMCFKVVNSQGDEAWVSVWTRQSKSNAPWELQYVELEYRARKIAVADYRKS